MRTTLDIADDVLAAAKAIGRQQGKSAGAILSDLARVGLRESKKIGWRDGLPFLVGRKTIEPVTLEIVNTLRDEEP